MAAAVIRLEERVKVLDKTQDKQDERINGLAKGMRSYALASRDITAEQAALSLRLSALEEKQSEQSKGDAQVRSQRIWLIGTIAVALISMITTLVGLYLQLR